MAATDTYQDGIRATFTLFFVEESTGIEAEINARHCRAPPTDFAYFVEATRRTLTAGDPTVVWRLMTDLEVTDYLERQQLEKDGGMEGH